MRSENDQTDQVQSKRDPYDAAVLQFLDQEISTSSGKAADPKTPVDDLDAIVDSLLQESVHATGTPSVAQDKGTEELDLLFSKIFKEDKVEGHAETEQVHLLEDVNADQKLELFGIAGMESGDLHGSVTARCLEPAAAASVPVEAVASSTVLSPLPPVLQTGTTGESPARDVVSLGNVKPDTIQVFHLPATKRAWNWQKAAIAAAFLCLVAGMGILLTKGSKKGTPGQPSRSAMPAAQPAASNDVAPQVRAAAANPSGETRSAAARTAKMVEPAKPAEATPADNPGKGGAPLKEAKPATGVQPAPAPDQSLTATIAADPVEKPAAVAAPPADNPVVAAPARVAESASPPPVPELITNTVNPRPSAILEDPATSRRPAIQPLVPAPAVPKRATPAVVISRVLPIYPEMARKSRITGTVVVEVMIDERGKVTKATPVSGPTILQAEAVNSVLRWQFRPANVEGIPVPSTNQVSIIFK